MENERFKNATKAHLIGQINVLEKRVEELKSQNMFLIEKEGISYELQQKEFYKGLCNAYENVLEVVKLFATKGGEE